MNIKMGCRYSYAFVFAFVFVLSVGMVSAVTYRHNGTDTMVLDDSGNLNITGNMTADYFFGNGSQLTDIQADNVADNANLGGNVTISENLTVGSDLSVTGNITTTDTGFFSWLGSLITRITGLFVQDIDFNGTISSDTDNINISASDGNVDTSGNVTANYFIGNGSLLTGVSGGTLGSSINTTEIEDGTITADDLAADSVNGTHIVDNVGLRNTNVAGNLNVTQNITLGGSNLYEEKGELIIDY